MLSIRRVRRRAGVGDIAVLDGISVNISDMRVEVAFVADEVLPEAAPPNITLALAVP